MNADFTDFFFDLSAFSAFVGGNIYYGFDLRKYYSANQ